jgi:hypothetical protein
MDYELLGKWMAKRIDEADATDPKLENLKQQLDVATKVVTAAEGDAVKPAVLAQSDAIWALIDYLASKRI